VSPPEKHTSRDAKNTTVRLTREDREAIHEISKALEAEHNERTRQNDILIDALWHYLKFTTGKALADIQAMLPPKKVKPHEKPKVTEITSPGKKQ